MIELTKMNVNVKWMDVSECRNQPKGKYPSFMNKVYLKSRFQILLQIIAIKGSNFDKNQRVGEKKNNKQRLKFVYENIYFQLIRDHIY